MSGNDAGPQQNTLTIEGNTLISKKKIIKIRKYFVGFTLVVYKPRL
jgi:hypothetical protein